MKIVARTSLKIESLIKISCCFVYGMDKHRADADYLRCPFDANQGIFEERAAKAFSLFMPVNR